MTADLHDPLPLAQSLIRCSSVTPADAGAQSVLADAVHKLGFTVTRLRYGEVPANSVVVAGSMPGKPLPNGEPGPSLYCAVIVKCVDAKTRSKTSINELLRD